MRNWFSKVGRLVALKQKNEHHSDFGFNQPSHPFALERIFHSHKCRTSKATSGSMKLVGNFENFWSPAMGWWASLRESHLLVPFRYRLSVSHFLTRELWKPGRSLRSYSLGSTGRTDSCSLSVSAQTARAPRPVPASSTELVPTQRSTVRWDVPTQPAQHDQLISPKKTIQKKTIIERASRSDPIFNRKMRSTDSIQGFHPTSWFLRRNITNPRLGNSEKVIVSNAMLLTPVQTNYLVVYSKHLLYQIKANMPKLWY